MNNINDINSFLSADRIAFFGVSSSGKKFSNDIYRKMKNKGYKLEAINPKTTSIENDICVSNYIQIDEPPHFALIMTPRDITLSILYENYDKGLKCIWFQPGSVNQEGIDFCLNHNIKVISDICIMMYLEEDKFPHNLHKFILKILKKLPN